MSVHPMETGPVVFLGRERFAANGAVAIVFETNDRAWASSHLSGKTRLFQRVRLDALEAMTEGRHDMPEGIVLAACRGLADLQAADVALSVVEAEGDLAAGSISIIAELGHSAAAFLTGERLAGSSARLSGLVLDEDALTAAIRLGKDIDRSGSAPIVHARAWTVLQAADAGVPCFWALPPGEEHAGALGRLRKAAIGNGFTDVAARGAAQWHALGAVLAGV